MDIELRLLRSFVAIYECGSVSRAADRMHCTQAAMSMRLKLLETEMKGALFDRHHHRLAPTSLGNDLYARALVVLATYDEMLSPARRPARARVRIGLPDDYALGFLGAMLGRLGPDADSIDIEVVCDLSANLYAQVQRRDIDLALVTLAAPPPDAALTVQAPLRWLTRSGETSDPVPLAAYPEGCAFRRAMIDALDTAGTPWRVVVQSRGHAGIMAAVRAGAAVTAVAAGTGPSDLTEVASTDSLPPLPGATISIVVAPGASQPATLHVASTLSAALSGHSASAAA